MREQQLSGQGKLEHRRIHARPIVERFFAWVAEHFAGRGLLPSSPFIKALAYVRQRRDALSVFLEDAEVAIDTNPLVNRTGIAGGSIR